MIEHPNDEPKEGAAMRGEKPDLERCPNCGLDWDEVDIDFQSCRKCKYGSEPCERHNKEDCDICLEYDTVVFGAELVRAKAEVKGAPVLTLEEAKAIAGGDPITEEALKEAGWDDPQGMGLWWKGRTYIGLLEDEWRATIMGEEIVVTTMQQLTKIEDLIKELG